VEKLHPVGAYYANKKELTGLLNLSSKFLAEGVESTIGCVVAAPVVAIAVSEPVPVLEKGTTRNTPERGEIRRLCEDL
jgi:hypothetical protein